MGDVRRSTRDVTRLLREAGRGKKRAFEELIPIVYSDLHERASRAMKGERAGHTLQTTALVHDAWLRLVDNERIEWRDRIHFFSAAATSMRRILVDHARARDARKRGRDWKRVQLEDLGFEASGEPGDLLALNEAFERLEAKDPALARIVELRIFAGLSTAEMADVLDVSTRTVQRDLRIAGAWLTRELSGREDSR